MAIGDIYHLSLQFRNNALNVVAENTLAYRAEFATVFDTQEEDLVEAYRLAAEALHVNLASVNWFLERYVVRILPENLITYEKSIGTEYGGGTGDGLPPQTAGVVSIRSAHPGRRGRGRIYLPSTSEANNSSEGLAIGAYLDGIVAWAEEAVYIGDGVTTANYTLGVWSVADQEFYEVQSVIGRNKWGTIRGRTN